MIKLMNVQNVAGRQSIHFLINGYPYSIEDDKDGSWNIYGPTGYIDNVESLSEAFAFAEEL